MITRKTLYNRLYKTDTAVLTSKFGSPRPNGRTHMGEDSDDITGNNPKIYMPFYGIVTHLRNELTDDRGRYVEIKVGNWYILIQHLQSIGVLKGQRIEKGKLLCVQGGSGKTMTQYASHLHYEFAKYPMGDLLRKSINPTSLMGFYTTFVEPKYPTKTVIVKDLNIRTNPGLNGTIIGKAEMGKAYTIFETVTKDGYVWGRIDWTLNEWIAIKKADGSKVYAK